MRSRLLKCAFCSFSGYKQICMEKDVGMTRVVSIVHGKGLEEGVKGRFLYVMLAFRIVG